MDFIKKIDNYYTNKIKQYGITSQGVDWNSKESQFLRFEQLSKIILDKRNFSILDFGCGYGALIKFLNNYYLDYLYIGYDISEEMIKNAKKVNASENLKFTNNKQQLSVSDYLIASGIFNVKLDTLTQDWENYIFSTLEDFNNLSIKGFSFNMLTSYSDRECRKDYLYYADPCYFFDYCKKKFSKNIALLHDYNLYEFTILVRK